MGTSSALMLFGCLGSKQNERQTYQHRLTHYTSQVDARMVLHCCPVTALPAQGSGGCEAPR